jgi:hypothetical protein
MSNERELQPMEIALSGSEPMSFIESESTSVTHLTQQEKDKLNIVGQTIQNYLTASENLAMNKLSNLRNNIPSYLSHPGNTLIAICTDGIVIRYENATTEKRKQYVGFSQDSIAQTARAMSQNLIQILSLGSISDSTFGIDIAFLIEGQEKLQTMLSFVLRFMSKILYLK